MSKLYNIHGAVRRFDSITIFANWRVCDFYRNIINGGRVVIEYDPDVHVLTFDKPQNALGMKTADLRFNFG